MLKKIFFGVLLMPFFYGCAKKEKNTTVPLTVVKADGIAINVYNYKGFAPLLEQDDDVLHVINFWATWCKPCIKELPYFELIGKRYASKKVKVTLVSLDLPTQIGEKLIPFIKKQHLENEVVLLDDVNANYWISQVDKEWSGAIPATLFYKGNKRRFHEKSFTYNELERAVKAML